MTPRRFQVNKRVEAALIHHHPWVYRNQCSSALDAIPVGSFVRLVATDNRFLGLGIHDPLSAIAIRVFGWEDEVEPDEEFFQKKLCKAWDKRVEDKLIHKTDGFRWVHGEADGLPGVVIDVFGKTAVAVFYLKSWQETLAPIIASVGKMFGLEKIFVKSPHGKIEPEGFLDLMSGQISVPEEPIWFQEGDLAYPSFPISGLKTGFFLDLREVRTRVKHLSGKGKAALNLFANDGVFSALCARAGFTRVISVERHEPSQEHARLLFDRWKLSFDEKNWLAADAWEFLKSPAGEAEFDLAIIDPPSLASKSEHLPRAKAAWSDLIRHTITRLKPGAELIAISCTERLEAKELLAWSAEAAGKLGRKLKLLAQPEASFDHPRLGTIPERDYLHAFHWQVS
jgi:23S rRNA (cytosine1962-C5)-methyltransferase